MDPWRIGISTQTPLVRWTHHVATAVAPADPTERVGEPPARGEVEGEGGASGGGPPGSQQIAVPRSTGPDLVDGRLREFHVSPGGVSRMVLQSIRAWHATGRLGEAHWFSLQPLGPEHIELDGMPVGLHHLRLAPEVMAGYARTKETLWGDLHGLPSKPFGPEDFRAFMAYNAATSDAILAQAPDLDAVYVHDFQLLQVGAMVGLAEPCVLRWHVPFDPSRIPEYTRNFVLRMMESFDAVIVSTRRDLEGLTNSGYRGTVRQIYPHTESADWAAPTAAAAQRFEHDTGLRINEPVVLCVARMDPMKRQDVLLQAMALLRRKHPLAKVVLVGNGSFSGSKSNGLGLSKAGQWRAHLESMAHQLGLGGRAIFTGWMPDDLVAAAYARADVLVLPSDIEGFGLTPFEAWGYRKPCIVTTGCGAAEVVQDGVTGSTVPPADPRALADALDSILSSPEKALRMGEAGRVALRGFEATRAAEAEWQVMEEARRRFHRKA
jgi:glycosyltransferase involved in cell wall biosynthesis